MARRRQASTGATLLLILLMGAVFVLGYIAPFIIIGLWAWSEYEARSIGAKLEQGEDRGQLRASIESSSRRIAQLHQEGDDLNLSRRQDRMFDARYAAGRDLNETIAGEEAAFAYNCQLLAAIVAPLARRDAMRGALIAYFGMLGWFWSRSSQINTFGMSMWASLVALVVGFITYAARKAHYAEN